MEKVFYNGTCIKVIELENGIKKLLLNRPDIRNAFNEEMIAEVTKVVSLLKDIKDPNDMRLLVIEGSGKAFCAGADLGYMKSLAGKSFEENIADANLLAKMFEVIVDFPTPVISIVHGAAIGGGFGLVSCSDFVIAVEEDALFATTEVQLGIVPAVISPYIIRKIGVSFASAMMLTGKKYTAKECVNFGLVNIITSKENLTSEVENIFNIFLLAAPNAARITKELIKNAYPLPTQAQIEFTVKQIALARASEEGKAGLTAFFTKKNPYWCDGIIK